MSNKLLVFDSHPVQYRVPIWQGIENESPGTIKVIYASDCSVKGYADAEFGKTFAWDEPLLSGYENAILNCVNGTPLSGPKSLTGEGVGEEMDKFHPSVVLITGLNYDFDRRVLKEANKRKIPVWLRCETQDYANHRSVIKGFLRSLIYRNLYKKISKFFYIGELNKQHYLFHGVKEKQLHPALYGTVDRYLQLNDEEKQNIRSIIRENNKLEESNIVVGFSGKFIPKKNPDILFAMLKHLPAEISSRIVLYFLGSGEMEAQLKDMATDALKKYGTKSIFTGFVNQSKIREHYLAMDMLVLPSRRMGETWGLVTNEALQAGCGVIVSDAVGSSVNFKNLERFRVFKEADAADLANKLQQLCYYERDFNWAADALVPYSMNTTVEEFIRQLKSI